MLELLRNPAGDIVVFSLYNTEQPNKCQELKTDGEQKLSEKLTIKQRPAIISFHYTKTLSTCIFISSGFLNMPINQSELASESEGTFPSLVSHLFFSIYLRLHRLRKHFILQSHPNTTLSFKASDSPSLKASRKERVTQA